MQAGFDSAVYSQIIDSLAICGEIYHLRAHDIWCAQAMAIFFYIACIEGRNVVDQAMPDSLSFVCALLSKNPQLFQWGEG